MLNYNEVKREVERIFLEVFPKKEYPNWKGICSLEIFLFLLETLGYIDNDISDAWALLSGYHFNGESLIDVDDFKLELIQKARGFVPALASSRYYKSLIEYYSSFSEKSKLIYSLEIKNKEYVLKRNRSIKLDKRRREIEVLFTRLIGIQMSSVDPFTDSYAMFHNEGVFEKVKIPKNKVEKINNIKESVIRNKRIKNIEVDLNELSDTARYIDERIKNKNYTKRLESISFEEVISNTSVNTRKIKIDGLYNLVGRVGAGKSTLVEILSVKLALEGKCVGIVVDSIKSVVELLSYFDKLNIKAVPIWGYKNKEEHIKKAYSSIVEDDLNDIEKTSFNKYFSQTCILDGLRDGSDIIDCFKIGKEPCLSLIKNIKDKSKKHCPFYKECPSHKAELDLVDARVYITTSAAFLKTKISPVVFDGAIKVGEYFYYNCDLVVFDECDRVQLSFDQGFTEYLTLVDNTEKSYLNQMGLKVEEWFYKNRLENVNNKRVKDWYDNFTNTQRISNLLIETLNNNKWLVNKISGRFVTALSLFGLFIEESEPKGEKEKELKMFIERTLNDKDREKVLDDIIYGLLSNNPEDINIDVDSELVTWFFGKHEVEYEAKIEVKFVIILALFEKLFMKMLKGFDEVYELDDIGLENISFMYRGIEDYKSVIPSSPTGNIFGIRVTEDENCNVKRLIIFKSNGLGRWLLTNYHLMYSKLNKEIKPNVLLLSGTSWAPGSYSYHIDIKVNGILNGPNQEADAIKESEFFFEPIFINNNYINVSGTELHLRVEKLKSLVAELLKKSIRTNKSRLDMELDILDDNRKKILLLVGSYNEAREVKKYMDSILSINGNIRRNEVALLIRDSDDEYSEDDIFRGQVTEFGLSDKKILIAPLMALERGYNILNYDNKAAIGSVYFLVRPMPIPNDLSIIVSKLNSKAMSNFNYKFKDIFTYNKAIKNTRNNNIKELQQLLIKSERLGYRQLNPHEINQLCMTLFVTICQVIGRLIRGGCKARVHFCDAKFAPQSTKNELDTTKTSIIVGIIEALDSLINSKDYEVQQIANRLYGPFYEGLRKCEGIKYDKR